MISENFQAPLFLNTYHLYKAVAKWTSMSADIVFYKV